MAEFEEAGELIDEAIDGVDDEAAEAEGLSEEEAAELEAEAGEAAEAGRTLGKVVDGLKELADLGLGFLKFVAKNAAIGAIFFGVTIALKKLFMKNPDDEKAKKQYAKVNSIADFLKASSQLSKKVSDWLQQHQKDMITLDGISVPLISIFVKYTDPLTDAADEVMKVSKQLMTKTSAGKTTFSTPNAAQVSKVVDNGQALTDALRKFQQFSVEESVKFPVLKTMPMTKDDVDYLQQKLDAIKNMPF